MKFSNRILLLAALAAASPAHLSDKVERTSSLPHRRGAVSVLGILSTIDSDLKTIRLDCFKWAASSISGLLLVANDIDRLNKDITTLTQDFNNTSAQYFTTTIANQLTSNCLSLLDPDATALLNCLDAQHISLANNARLLLSQQLDATVAHLGGYADSIKHKNIYQQLGDYYNCISKIINKFKVLSLKIHP